MQRSPSDDAKREIIDASNVLISFGVEKEIFDSFHEEGKWTAWSNIIKHMKELNGKHGSR